MFGSYSVINVVVLLNLLIAMMSNSYQVISVSPFILTSTKKLVTQEKLCLFDNNVFLLYQNILSSLNFKYFTF